MESIYDWLTLGIFAGLVVLFLHRSTSQRESDSDCDSKDDSLLLYLLAGVGCAVGNYLGNEGQDLLAVLVIVATLAFATYFLKPFSAWPRS